MIGATVGAYLNKLRYEIWGLRDKRLLAYVDGVVLENRVILTDRGWRKANKHKQLVHLQQPAANRDLDGEV
jgi:hypothetical protein